MRFYFRFLRVDGEDRRAGRIMPVEGMGELEIGFDGKEVVIHATGGSCAQVQDPIYILLTCLAKVGAELGVAIRTCKRRGDGVKGTEENIPDTVILTPKKKGE